MSAGPSRLPRWVAPRPVDWVFTFIYASAVALALVRDSSVEGMPEALRDAGVVAAVVGLVVLDRWQHGSAGSRRAVAVALGVRVVLVEAAVLLAGFGVTSFLYVVLPLAAALSLGTVVGVVTGAATWVVFVGKLTWAKPGWPADEASTTNLVVFTLAVGFVVALARVAAAERAGRDRTERLLDDLRRSYRALAARAAEVEELATTRERNRLAREIHDSLGHYLTVINVQLEKAVAFRDRDAVQADDAVAAARRLAGDALADVRRSVGALRDGSEPFVLETALVTLAAALRTPDRTVTVTVDGDASDASRRAMLTAYRGAQEALTNVERHASASTVEVRVAVTPELVRVTVRDDGVGFDPGLLGGLPPGRTDRLGLAGLAERAELDGGRLTVSSALGVGTTVDVQVPRHQALVPGGCAP